MRKAAVDFRFKAVLRLARFRTFRGAAALFCRIATSAMVDVPREFHFKEAEAFRIEKPAQRRLRVMLARQRIFVTAARDLTDRCGEIPCLSFA
jgi:hypothetical protein